MENQTRGRAVATTWRLLSVLLAAAWSVHWAHAVSPLITVVRAGPTYGETASKNDNLVVHFVGWYLQDGKEIQFVDSREEPGELSFWLGQGMVVKGWDEGLVGMRVGDVWSLRLPPQLAFGEKEFQGVPPHSHVRFEVELLELHKPRAEPPNLWKRMDEHGDGDGVLTRDEYVDFLVGEYDMGEEEAGLVFEGDDANQDGRVTWFEFMRPKGMEPPPNAKA